MLRGVMNIQFVEDTFGFLGFKGSHGLAFQFSDRSNLPALIKAGCDIRRQVREQVYFTDGRIYVKGNLTH